MAPTWAGPGLFDLMKEKIQGEQTPALSADRQYSAGNSSPYQVLSGVWFGDI